MNDTRVDMATADRRLFLQGLTGSMTAGLLPMTGRQAHGLVPMIVGELAWPAFRFLVGRIGAVEVLKSAATSAVARASGWLATKFAKRSLNYKFFRTVERVIDGAGTLQTIQEVYDDCIYFFGGSTTDEQGRICVNVPFLRENTTGEMARFAALDRYCIEALAGSNDRTAPTLLQKLAFNLVEDQKAGRKIPNPDHYARHMIMPVGPEQRLPNSSRIEVTFPTAAGQVHIMHPKPAENGSCRGDFMAAVSVNGKVAKRWMTSAHLDLASTL